MNDYEKLIRLLFEAMNSREFGAFEKAITDNVAFDFPGVGRTEGARRPLFHFSGDRISFISDYFKDTSFTEKVVQKT